MAELASAERCGGRSSAPRSATRAYRSRPIWWTATSDPWHQTGCGLRTSPTSRPGRGWCYTAFVIDAYARRILGWSVATTMTSRFVVDAAEQAIWTRGREGRDLAGLVAHHDHGVQYLSVAYSEHLATAGGKALDRRCRVQPPQRLGEVGDRALQDRVDQAEAAVEGPR
jgi:transposase InsO family protein